jgi:hypothetical protein
LRPIGRTSSSSKRTALPPSLNSITSCLPSVSAAPINWSPSSRSTAMMPALRGLLNSSSAVFLTVPSAVAMKMKWSAGKLRNSPVSGSTT